ncbi:hypothetical protein V6N13_007783 [Hibiscus sabdariffa]
MYLPLSWRWPWWWWVCYAWCTSRIPFGAALRFNVSRGGAGLVQLASSTSDNSEGCLCADLVHWHPCLYQLGMRWMLPWPFLALVCPDASIGCFTPSASPWWRPRKWLSLGFPQCPACFCAAGALFVALCGAGPRPYLEVTLRVTYPLIGFGVRYTGHAPCSCCLARPVHWHPCLRPLGMRWMLPWTFLASVCPDASIGCFTPSESPWWRPPGCAFVPQPRCPFRRLAARPVRALPWPVRPLVAWRACHHWAGLFDVATPHAAGVSPAAPVTSSAPVARSSLPAPTSSAPTSADPEHDSYNPMVHTATFDMLEDALAISTDCALLVDIDGIIQSNGEDLVHGAINEAAETLIHEVAASVLGCTPLSIGTDATVASVTSASTSTSSPTAPGLSRSAPACARRLPMPALPEHQEFDTRYAA